MNRRPHILVRSSWQVVNIGDIAHTPGLLAVLERHLPDARVTLWATHLGEHVRRILAMRFPRVRLLEGTDAGVSAVAESDLVVHGSGPGLPGVDAVRLAHHLGKPYGFAGISLSDDDIGRHASLLAAARFVFTRETHSLDALRRADIHPEVAAFGPDASFACDLRDEVRAGQTLAALGLTPRRFLCVVPRLRWTPYWEIHPQTTRPSTERIEYNRAHAEPDHAKLRHAIVTWVESTGQRVLLAPEMSYAVPLLRPLLFDGLPASIKPHVESLDRYWLTDEAASIYARASAVLSLEMHSPILAIAAGTPAVHVRQPTDGRKGQMWNDLGLSDWLLDIDSADGADIAARVVQIGSNADSARAAATAAGERAHRLLASVAQAVRDSVGIGDSR